MAPFKDYITETEAAKICSVSVNTLNRFIDTGYLQVELNNDGSRLFSKDELKKVFGISDASLDSKINPPYEDIFTSNLARKPMVHSTDEDTAENKRSGLRLVRSDDAEEIFGTKNNTAPVEEVAESKIEEPLISKGEEPLKAEPVSSEENTSDSNAASTDDEATNKSPEKMMAPESSVVYPDFKASKSRNVELLEAEINKLNHVVPLLEKILELREGEIETLKKQNAWLQERIEKMEERSTREQILLLAESENVRRLVSQQKRSPIRAALEWLGLAEDTNYKSTIDAEKSK